MSGCWEPSTSAAKPCGNCYRCGGQLYIGLVHHCQTAVRWNGLPLLTNVQMPRAVSGQETP